MPNERETESQELLLFEVEGHRFGLPSSAVRELLRAVAVTRLPGNGRERPGVIDLRGRLVDVLDLRGRLGLPTRDLIPSDQLVIAHTDDGLIALPVDRAWELVRLPISSGRGSRRSDTPDLPVDAVARHPDGPIPVLSVNSIRGRTGAAPGERGGDEW